MIIQSVERFGPIGSGSFGCVFRGGWNGAEVALKLVSGEPELLLREAETLRRLRHDHVLSYRGIGRTADSSLFIITDLLPHGSLFDFLRGIWARGEHELFGLQEIVYAFRGVVEALIYLESEGCVHRDIRCHNLLLKPDAALPGAWTVVLADFGLARFCIGEQHSNSGGRNLMQLVGA